ncbi:MAG: hypothetical protein HQ551_12770 [Desulfobacteraceae bacterium]|nr:hypothetical protein [Desulfobacteraceae bacterium]
MIEKPLFLGQTIGDSALCVKPNPTFPLAIGPYGIEEVDSIMTEGVAESPESAYYIGH